MASKKYCRHCDKYVMAEYSYATTPVALMFLVLLSCGLLLPFIWPLWLFTDRSGYVCKRCLEKV